MSSVTGKRRWLLPLAILALAIGLFVMLTASRPKAPAKPASSNAWSVRTQTVQPAAYAPELQLYGQLESPHQATLTAAISAFVEQVDVREGQVVNQGQRLLQLDQRDVALVVRQRQADLDNVQARLDSALTQHQANQKALAIEQQLLALAQRNVQRYQDLAKRQVAAQGQLDDAKRSYQQQALALNNRRQTIDSFAATQAQLAAERSRLQALYDAALLDQQRSIISAPFNARITAVKVAQGDRVRSGDALLSLYDNQQIQIRAKLPDRVLGAVEHALANGQTLPATAYLGNQLLHLHLVRLAGQVTPDKTGVDAFFELAKGQTAPPLGQTLAITLALPEQDNLIAIPATALYGTDQVYRVVQGKLQAVTVTRAGYRQDHILIHAGTLNPGDALVTTQLPNAITGLPVQELPE